MSEITVECPGCGKTITYVPHSTLPGRLVARCDCNAGRAVLEVWKDNVVPKRSRRRVRRHAGAADTVESDEGNVKGGVLDAD